MSRSAVPVLLALSLAKGVQICGNYCGPHWCDGQDQAECLKSADPTDCTERGCSEKGPTDGSCEDACCKDHDSCCGSHNTRPCNDAFYACLEACANNPSGQACYAQPLSGLPFGGFIPKAPIPHEAILKGMQGVLGLTGHGEMCCGSPCDGSIGGDSILGPDGGSFKVGIPFLPISEAENPKEAAATAEPAEAAEVEEPSRQEHIRCRMLPVAGIAAALVSFTTWTVVRRRREQASENGPDFQILLN